jgi:centromere/kinetochore protein ZW10
LWQEKIYWKEECETVNSKSVSLCIQCNSNELVDIIEALHLVNKVSKCIQSFSTKFLQYFIKPIILNNCIIENTDKTFLVKVLNDKELPQYKTILDNLKSVFKFLHDQFDIIIQNEECFLSRLSASLLDDFLHILTHNCISKIVPASTSELQTFKFTVAEIEEFQNYLIKIKFISEDQKFLSTYTTDIDKLYIDKKCEKLLEVARTIIKKELHDSIRYEPDDLKVFNDNDQMTDDIMIDRKLSKFTFYLPACQIR